MLSYFASAPVADDSVVPTRSPLQTSQFRPGRAAAVLVLLLVAVGVAGAVAGGLYVRWVRQPAAENAESNRERMMRMVGLRDRVQNRLDPKFTDADGDLVADAPTDPKLLIDPPTLVFSYVAVAEPEAYRDAWKPFTDHLARITGKPVEYALLGSVQEQLRALAEGRLHVTGLNSGSVPTAVNVCGFVPVVKLPTEDGSGMSRMRIIVPASSDVHGMPDLKAHELTLTDPGSNSGYKAAVVLLRSDFGLLPVRDYTIRYSGSHDDSIVGIAKKQYQAAAVADDMLGRAVARGAIGKDQFRSIYDSERFPTAGLGYLYNLKPELAAKVREAFTTFDWKDSPLQEKLGTAGGTKFVPVNYKNDWALIRRIDDESGAVAGIGPTSAPTTMPVGQ